MTPTTIVNTINREGLQPHEHHALDILENLPLEELNQIKAALHLNSPGVIGPTTLAKFLELAQARNLDLSEAGVNAFKEAHNLGNSGALKGIIGRQTAEVYFAALMSYHRASSGDNGPAQFASTPAPGHINSAGLDLVKEFEGLARQLSDGRIAAYLDAVGIPTIGYGHTAGVQMGQVISVQEADRFLRQDLQEAETAVSQLVQARINENQFSALVSFVFNLGGGAFAESTLLREVNAGNLQAAAAQFPRWVYAGGRQLPGLVRRRQAEQALFLA